MVTIVQDQIPCAGYVIARRIDDRHIQCGGCWDDGKTRRYFARDALPEQYPREELDDSIKGVSTPWPCWIGEKLLERYGSPEAVERLFDNPYQPIVAVEPGETMYGEVDNAAFYTYPYWYLVFSERELRSHIKRPRAMLLYDRDQQWYYISGKNCVPFHIKLPLSMVIANLDAPDGYEAMHYVDAWRSKTIRRENTFVNRVRKMLVEKVFLRDAAADETFKWYLRTKEIGAEDMERAYARAVEQADSSDWDEVLPEELDAPMRGDCFSEGAPWNLESFPRYIDGDIYETVWDYFDDWVVVRTDESGAGIGELVMKPKTEHHIETCWW